ncbi:hypothetical protein KJ652_03085 [Patescibacteria group bacterium]|nr:hypothetical protein [Patescibacteria group bacterium]MBU1123552.1 hypothetical protein [Patescibacteria group bacterium]MBU1911603.1 hypothetical protein [Patescibacteria group bacterium]
MFYDDDDDKKPEDDNSEEEQIVEAGDYNLGEDIGAMIDEGQDSDTAQL